MKDDFERPFEVKIKENNDPSRPHFYLCNGLITSKLFSTREVMLLIYLIAFADNNEPNQINTTTISINKLSQRTKVSKATIYKYIKLLEEKGVLIKKKHISEDNGYLANTYQILNFVSVWNCKTLDELKKETNRIKSED